MTTLSKKTFAKCAAAAVIVTTMSGCATVVKQQITVAPNDLCQVEATNDKGEVIGSQHSAACHDAKIQRITTELKAEVVKANLTTQTTAEEQRLKLAATQEQEIFKTAALAGRFALANGTVSYSDYKDILYPLVLKAGESDEGRMLLKQDGFDVVQLKSMGEAEDSYKTQICEAKAEAGYQAVNPTPILEKFNLVNVLSFPGYVDMNPQPHGPCVAPDTPSL